MTAAKPEETSGLKQIWADTVTCSRPFLSVLFSSDLFLYYSFVLFPLDISLLLEFIHADRTVLRLVIS